MFTPPGVQISYKSTDLSFVPLLNFTISGPYFISPYTCSRVWCITPEIPTLTERERDFGAGSSSWFIWTSDWFWIQLVNSKAVLFTQITWCGYCWSDCVVMCLNKYWLCLKSWLWVLVVLRNPAPLNQHKSLTKLLLTRATNEEHHNYEIHFLTIQNGSDYQLIGRRLQKKKRIKPREQTFYISY